MKTEQLFDAAFAQHQAGNLHEAQALYQAVLEAEPIHADALHLLGVLAFQVKALVLAEQLIQCAIDVKPSAGYFGNLGLVLASTGKMGPAIAAYRRAVALRPEFAEAHNNLANALRQTGRLSEAIQAYRRAIAARPDFYEAHNNLGLSLSADGQWDDAIAAYRQAIVLQPNSAETRNNLGIALSRKGEWQKAIDCWREALSLRDDYAAVHNNLGNAFKHLGQNDHAVAALRMALQLNPALPEAHNNLGVIFLSRGHVDDAIAAYHAALAASPEFADAHFNLAIALHQSGELPQAIASCKRAIVFRPDWAEAHNNLGIWLGESAKLEEALAAFDAAIGVRPRYTDAHSNRGNVLRQMGMLDAAIDSYQRAISQCPVHAQAWNNLGTVYKQLGRMDDAITAFGEALAIQPGLAEAHNNLGNVLKDQGQLDAALACYERALALNSRDAAVDSNRVYSLHFHPAWTGEMILAEHQRWNFRHAEHLRGNIKPHENDRSPDRRLRIGYVAPDFRDHCQSFFTLPLLSNHDRGNFEIFCYADVAAPDAITERIRGHADGWRNIVGQSDARVAEMIRRDEIDILLDLTVHMSHNRLAVFARKPAPIQVTWLGYPGTSGLEAMDYRLSDPYLDPPGNDAFYTEQTIRLPDSFWCYDPLCAEPAVNALPALSNGLITFGCLNNFCKINDGMTRLWAQVMRQTPRSRLLLLAPEGTARRRLLDILGDGGIDASRVEFSGRLSRQRYLELYHRIDIGLDTFPYNGHTTSLDSAWMGVPVVTRAGETAVSRGGFSQLWNLGLPELAADSNDGFVETAVELAGDVNRLCELRATLRGRLEQSPLMDASRFARNMEAAYRAMWGRWIGAAQTPLPDSHGIELYIMEAAARPAKVRPLVRQAS
ncbi:MAG TPA: tetratricopeptide repeat protein [Tepidisphaeraceae bacterium]|nr:tetratricopeptide repeat protein [Tepidisphaeraceae bacterium]